MAYKYLGVEEKQNVEHKNEKLRFRGEYVRKLGPILNKDCSAKRMKSVGSLA
jgi:hypothetical protein